MPSKGQVENADTVEGSRNEARVEAAEPRITNTTVAPGIISMQRVAPSQQPDTLVSNSNSLSSRTSGQQQQSANSGSIVGQRGWSRVKQVDVEEKVKQSVESSSGIFKDCVELLPSSDEEDLCPTCLEEYDEENPKITSKCNHHFHLSCILEWKKRSTLCPVCNKPMVFEQMT